MKNIHCFLYVWAISLGFLSPLFGQDASPSKAVPGGLSSKKGSGKIFPPNSKFLKVAGHDAYLALPEGLDAGKKTPWLWYCPSDYKLPGKLEQWMMKQCLDNGIAVAGIDVKGDFGKFGRFWQNSRSAHVGMTYVASVGSVGHARLRERVTTHVTRSPHVT